MTQGRRPATAPTFASPTQIEADSNRWEHLEQPAQLVPTESEHSATTEMDSSASAKLEATSQYGGIL
eukprot:CAMPEP_0204437692 /NCGR_PEP_ID=MMETSP0470-20130426/77864_1 /ASSEMBLY_ACC=CAM_ASM_000385 /TAXON_ID=2969 /ORGANISM="Oxyrrhis marina" /LENGTH=66 /DNA_ID=CAMNT_0051436439 /DNA_START=253 /DNA_END=453 /DNA_ORIENTATION=+